MRPDRSPRSRRPVRSPKRFLDRLVRDTARTLTPPVRPEAFLHAVCATLGPQLDRPVRLKFVGFPPGLDISGATFALDDAYVVVVEERAPDEHKFVIAGHEIGHIHFRTLDVHQPAGIPAAARRLLARADEDVPWARVVALAARSPTTAAAEAEWEAEECGLRLAAKFRRVVGPGAAAGRTTQDTLTGRLSSSLGNIGGP
ncbi:hypothetical protein [Streptomyces collinus]|uniref:hypothetical protein n=1 Tax=Streptomyces collinus TaxID=42684 RepID=UPI001F2648C7|nr:hypothetical protein [Streptomyces collinus]UJA07899.1 hypothetical protein HGI10_18000 [Streptomyces collinus]UJA17235.1 hypothetical protein HGI09_46100 [Streptomyces collinus]